MVQQDSVAAAERFGLSVRKLRQDRGWSQQRLADAMAELGFPWRQVTAGRTETADRPVPVDEVDALARIFGVSAGVLLGEAPASDGARLLEAVVRTAKALHEAERIARPAQEAAAAAAEYVAFARRDAQAAQAAYDRWQSEGGGS